MSTKTCARFVFGLASVLTLWLVAVVPAGAQQPSGGTAPQNIEADDRQHGEGDRIERRHEWFWSARRAGVSSPAEAAQLRRAAVEQTRRAIGRQKLRRSLGFDSVENFWVSMGPSPSHFGSWDIGDVSGRVSSLTADWTTGTIYLGSASGGMWKSTNDGLSWTNLFETAGTLTIGTVAVDPNDSNTLWVGTGENNQGCESYFGIGLLRSIDGGVNWETRNGSGATSLDDLSSFADISIDPRDSNKLITGGRIRGCTGGSSSNGGIFTSDDAGLTWTERLSGVQVYEIQRDPVVLDTVWAATSNSVYKSEDNGVTWVAESGGQFPTGYTGRTELAIAPSDGETVYVLFQNGQFYHTSNGGRQWRRRSSGACDGQCSYNMVLRVDPNDPNTIYRGTIHVFKSIDNGRTWTDLSNNWGPQQKVHQDTHALLMDPNNPDTVWVGSDGGVWKSIDGGATFLNRNGNLNLTQFYAVGVHPFDPGTACGGAQDNSSLARTTSNVWDLQAVTGDGFVCQFNNVDPNYVYITSYPSGGYPNVWRSTNGTFGGWSDITGSSSGVQSGDRSNWVTPYELDPTSPNILYLGTHRIYRSIDHGTSWTQVGPADLTGGSGSLRSVEVNRNFPNVIFTGSASGMVWRSTDSGTNFTDITAGLPSRQISDIAADPSDPDRALATVTGFGTAHLWEWTLAGGWVAVGGGLTDVPANTVYMRTSTDVFVGTDTGVYRSGDGGVTFVPYMNDLPQGLVVTDLRYSETFELLTAGTYGRGVYQVSVGPIIPDVVFDSIELPLVEVDGDGDLDVEPGETWDVRPLLRNRGGQTALGVQARVATSTPGAAMLQPDTLTVGDMTGGAIIGPATHYRFVVDPTFPCGSDIEFDLVDITSTNAPVNYLDQIGAFSVTVPSGCQVTYWPGSVPADVQVDLLPGGEVQVSWSTACNTGELAGQTYSVQYGDLDLLHSTGTYNHVPISDDCSRTSPAVFTPPAANQYYLVVPNEGGREGGAGEDTSPAARPQIVNTCGERRIATCP